MAEINPFDVIKSQTCSKLPTSLFEDFWTHKAKTLALKAFIVVVRGETENPDPLFDIWNPIDAVFLVREFQPGLDGYEEAQVHGIIDAAISRGVKHPVFSSVDFSSVDRGDVRSADNPTMSSILQNVAAGSKMKTTITRPVAFMDNFTPNLPGRAFMNMWKELKQKPLQLISLRNYGVWAAGAFADPNCYNGRAITLAGDSLTFTTAKEIFKTNTGYAMPETFRLVGTLLKRRWNAKQMRQMFAWFKAEGFNADLDELRRVVPRLQSFRTWLTESSEFKKKKK